jgi:hypothetical protein
MLSGRHAPTLDVRRWRTMSWPISVGLFAVPAFLTLATILLPGLLPAPEVLLRVTDRYTGQQIQGAEVSTGDEVLTTAADGTITIVVPEDQLEVTIEAPEYEVVTTVLSRQGPREWQVALRPNTLQGTLIDAASSRGISGASVALVAPNAPELTARTDAEGRFSLTGIPEDALLKVSSADYGEFEEPLGKRTVLDLELRPSFVEGTIVDVNGNPVPGARLSATNGSAETITGADGTFRLTGGTEVAEVHVSAPGFADQSVAVAESRRVELVLQDEMIKAVYANLGVLGDRERWNRLIEIADTTEVNAIVVDVKQDTIYYDTQVPFFQNIDGMVTPVYDVQELLAELDAHGIYSIARMVVFKDPVVAEGRPDLAVLDEVNGGLWRDVNGAAWVNAFNQELWQANADLGAELARLGFDEVQYDYIRLPSDGDLRTADFGVEYTEANRRAAITGAVALGAREVRAAGARFAIDLFPIVALFGDDQGIGQTLQDLTPLADYVCLMIYPSHYERGNIPVEGHPNDFPSETVTHTLEVSQQFAPGSMAKMRPWLQDFTYPLEGYSAYDAADVRAQIDAAEAMGASGWMLWNAAGEFQAEALRPE